MSKKREQEEKENLRWRVQPVRSMPLGKDRGSTCFKRWRSKTTERIARPGPVPSGGEDRHLRHLRDALSGKGVQEKIAWQGEGVAAFRRRTVYTRGKKHEKTAEPPGDTLVGKKKRESWTAVSGSRSSSKTESLGKEEGRGSRDPMLP